MYYIYVLCISIFIGCKQVVEDYYLVGGNKIIQYMLLFYYIYVCVCAYEYVYVYVCLPFSFTGTS